MHGDNIGLLHGILPESGWRRLLEMLRSLGVLSLLLVLHVYRGTLLMWLLRLLWLW